MSRNVLVLALLLAVPAGAEPPALTVLIAVDQMRADYLDRFPGYTGGFERLRREGAVFTQARQAHVPTETAVGHAALGTGCFPAQHGIVGNEWPEPATGRPVYGAGDADGGRGPFQLECPTLADALKKARPASRAVSVAGKDRAAILMGGRAASPVLWYQKKTSRYATSAFYGEPPAWAAAVSTSPLDTASARFDEATLAVASRAIDELSLGSRGENDLLTVGLSATDYLGHALGPDAPEIEAQLRALDKMLGAFFDSLDRRVGKGRWVVALSADHGVSRLPEKTAGASVRVVQPDMMKELEERLVAKLGPPPAAAGRWVLDLHSPHVWLASPSALPAARKYLRGRKELARVYTEKELLAGAEGPFMDVYRRSVRPGRSGDLLILFKPGYTPADMKTGADHGLPYDDDARVPLVLLGAGVKPGRREEPVLATDLAPTLARLLEVDLAPRAPSRVLVEALAP